MGTGSGRDRQKPGISLLGRCLSPIFHNLCLLRACPKRMRQRRQRMKRLLFAWAGLASLVMASAAQARVEADPNKDYKVTPDVGPWMICATCYEGELATQLGHEMVLELRSRFDLPAYVMNKGEAERRRQLEEWQRWHQQFPEANV